MHKLEYYSVLRKNEMFSKMDVLRMDNFKFYTISKIKTKKKKDKFVLLYLHHSAHVFIHAQEHTNTHTSTHTHTPYTDQNKSTSIKRKKTKKLNVR